MPEPDVQTITQSEVVDIAESSFPGFRSAVDVENSSSESIKVASELYSRYVYPNGPYNAIAVVDDTIHLADPQTPVSTKTRNGASELARNEGYKNAEYDTDGEVLLFDK